MSINKVILIGNLGQDPEIRAFSDGNEVANFSLATSESWKDKNTGERKEKTEWHKVAVFSQGLVNIIKNYVKKGSKIYLEGSLQTRKWQDNSGNDHYTTEVVLQGFNAKIVLLGSRKDDSNQSDIAQQKADYEVMKKNSEKLANGEELDDEIPF